MRYNKKLSRLTKKQCSVLVALRYHGWWEKDCGWTYRFDSTMYKVLNTLVERGYAVERDGRYIPTSKIYPLPDSGILYAPMFAWVQDLIPSEFDDLEEEIVEEEIEEEEFGDDED
jgi:DNA-binding PadR family transcriptional regulator